MNSDDLQSPTAQLIGPSIEVDSSRVHLDADGQPKIIEMRFVVEEDFHGYRLDHYLKRKIRRLSRTKIQKVIRTQLTGPRPMKPHSPVLTGDKLLIRRPARAEPPCPRTFQVLVDEADYLVVDKPAGLPVHASARYYFNTLTRLLSERFPGQPLQLAHRLDRETSGCLLIARGKAAASLLKSAFAKRRVTKVYLAVVYGEPEWDSRTIDLPLALAPGAIGVKVRPVPDDPNAWPATTEFRVVSRHEYVSVVECLPLTGRQHQIRAHLTAAGHPIVGDKLYAHGDEAFARYCERQLSSTDEEIAAEFGHSRQALHAASITFPDPRTGLPVTITSPLPEDLRALLGTASVVGCRRLVPPGDG